MSISVETLALAKKNTKQAVEEAVTSVYRYKGSVETFEDLPTSGQKVGDVYNVEKEAGRNYAWDGSDWDSLGIAENLGDIEFEGPGEAEVVVSFDGNNDRIVYSEYVDFSKAIPLENLISNKIIIEHEGHNNPYYLGYGFSNSANDISLYSGPGIPVQNTNNRSVYTIQNYESYKKTYKYFFLPLTHEKRGPQGQSTGEKEEYFINPIIKYTVLEQGMVTKTINQNFDDSNTVDEKVQVAKDAAQAANNQANAAYNRANTAYNVANNAYNVANIANNSLNDLGNIEFSNSSITTTVTKDLTNDKTTSWGIPIRAREVKDGKITIKVTNNQDMPTIQYPSSFGGGYGPTPQQATGGPGGSYTPSISSNVDEYIFIISSTVIQNDYYIFINNEVSNRGSSTGFSFQGTLSYETEVAETHTINNDYYDKDATNSLTNDTLNAAKAYTDSKFDISLKKEVVQVLPAEGEEDILYLVPKADAETEDIYDEYIWTNNAWEKIGSTATDLNNYYNKTQIDNMRQLDGRAIEYAANTADNAYDTANDATNLAQAAYDAANSLAPAAWQEISNVTTNEATNSVTLPIDKEYEEYLITFNRPIVMDGPNPADSMTSNDGSLLLSIGGQTVIGSKLSIYNKMDGIYTIKRIIDNMYYGTGYHNSLMSNMKDYTENIVDINDASNGGVVLSTSASGSTANIASNVTITLYGKGGTPQ